MVYSANERPCMAYLPRESVCDILISFDVLSSAQFAVFSVWHHGKWSWNEMQKSTKTCHRVYERLQ